MPRLETQGQARADLRLRSSNSNGTVLPLGKSQQSRGWEEQSSWRPLWALPTARFSRVI